MKGIIFIVGMLCVSLFIGTVSAQENEQPKEASSQVKESAASQPNVEQPAQEEPTISDFYNQPGFELIPSSKTFKIRNTLKNTLYYDTNVLFTEDNEKGRGVYELELFSKLDISMEKLTIGIEGGFRYEKYIDVDDLDEVLPRGTLSLDYEDDIFYFSLSNTVTRNATVRSLELIDARAIWVNNQVLATLGARYKLYFAEVSFSHNYANFQKIQGDYLIYEPTVRIGHELSERVSITAEYKLDMIDYREPYMVGTTDPTTQEDTTGHTILAGANVKISKVLEGYIRLGAQVRESNTYFASRINLTWTPQPKWKVALESSHQTLPSFVGDFQQVTDFALRVNYWIMKDLAMNFSMQVMYIDPHPGEPSIGYFPQIAFTYHAHKGIDLEAFYKGSFRRTDVDGADYDQSAIGGSVTLIF